MAIIGIKGEQDALARRSEALLHLCRSSLAAESLEELASAVLDHLRPVLPFEQAVVSYWESQPGHARVLAAVPARGQLSNGRGSLPITEIDPDGVLRSGRPVEVTGDLARTHLRPLGLRVGAEAQTYLAVPLPASTGAMGALHFTFADRPNLHESDLQITEQAAELLGLAVRRLEAHLGLRRRKDELEFVMARRSVELEQQYLRRSALAEIELAINQPHELEGVLDRITEITTRLLPATGGVSVILWDVRTDEFYIRSSTVPGHAAHTVFERVQRREGATRWIIDHRQPLVVPDVTQGPYGTTRMLADLGYQAYAGVPLLAEGAVLGVLYAVDQVPRAYSDEDVSFLVSLANRAAVAVSKVQLYERLQAAKWLLEHKSRQLEAANQELQELAYIVSHDLKAPLRGLHSLADWLAQDYADRLDDRGRELIDLLFNRVRRMHALIDGVLQYSRVIQDDQQPADLEVDPLVREVVDLISPPEHITVRIDGYLPVVRADEIRLRQVFQNLLSNAIKYIEQEQGEITIAGQESDTGWEFRVGDNGRGIAPRDHERIFQLFQTIDSKDPYVSTGVGLAVVKKIVESWGGKVWLDSDEGRGSTFYFSIPKVPEPGD